MEVSRAGVAIDEAQLVLQHKKDQFRVEIRKKKVDQLIQAKRVKIFTSSEFSHHSSQLPPTPAPPLHPHPTEQVHIFENLSVELQSKLTQTPAASSSDISIVLTRIAWLVGVNPSPIDEVFATPLPKLIVEIFSSGDLHHQKLAGSILANLTAGSSDQVQLLFSFNLLPSLLLHIRQKNLEIADHAIWALNNALHDLLKTDETLKAVFTHSPHIVEDLCYYFKCPERNKLANPLAFTSTLLLALYNITRIHKFTHAYYDHLRICLPYLAYFLNNNYPHIQANRSSSAQQPWEPSEDHQDQSYAQQLPPQPSKELSSQDLLRSVIILSDLSEGDARVVSDMIKSSVDIVMLRYLQIYPSIQLPMRDNLSLFVIRTLANISSGNDHQTDTLIQKNIFAYIKPYLSHPTVSIRVEISWLISNLAAGNARQIEAFLAPNTGIFDNILYSLQTEMQLDVRKELLFAICNPTEQATKEQIEYMLSKGLVSIISENIQMDLSTTVLVQLLESVENVLNKSFSTDIPLQSQMVKANNLCFAAYESSGCHEKVQKLFYEHKDTQVNAIAGKILQIVAKIC